VGVLDHVVEHCGLERGHVHPQVGHDRGHGQGVFDEILAGQALLTVVGLLGERVRLLQRAEVGLGVAGLDQLGQSLE